MYQTHHCVCKLKLSQSTSGRTKHCFQRLTPFSHLFHSRSPCSLLRWPTCQTQWLQWCWPFDLQKWQFCFLHVTVFASPNLSARSTWTSTQILHAVRSLLLNLEVGALSVGLARCYIYNVWCWILLLSDLMTDYITYDLRYWSIEMCVP